MNCLFSKPQGEKLELMANKVQNKGAGGGSFLSVLFSVISKSWFCCLQPKPPLLFSPETQPHPSFQSLSTVSHLQRGKVQLETFLKQTTLLWSKRLFLKIASLMMLSDISAFSSLKEFKLTSFESLLKEREKKKISSKLGVAVQGVAQEWLRAVLSMNSGSGEISSNSSICTFCARFGFELHFFFLLLDKPGLCMLEVHCFVPPFEELSMQK